MLGVRLGSELEARLNRHARAVRRSKSDIVRDWVAECLDRDSIDAEMREAARILALHDHADDYIEGDLDD